MTSSTNRLLGAILLITGTCIGAGMLALPISTAAYGFIPSSALFIICWAVMAFSALLILEVTLWLEPGANLITMGKATLGWFGQALAWTAYLLLLYCLMAAYLSGMNALITQALEAITHTHIYPWIGSLILILLFGIIIYLGAKPIDYINRLLMVGLVVAYAALITLIAPYTEISKLDFQQFNKLWFALPIVITSFGFHIIIPSVRTYLKNDVKKLRLAILIGSTIPLIVYVVWEFLIFSVLPAKGPHGLSSILQSGQPTIDLTHLLHLKLHNPWLDEIFQLFAFFMISTSFIGVSFSLFDFLADGFHVKKTKLSRLSTAAITFIPPLLFALLYPKGFIVALGYAGIFVAVLLCILPALMVWSGRYWKKLAAPAGEAGPGYRVFGGPIPLLLLIIFSIGVIVAELMA